MYRRTREPWHEKKVSEVEKLLKTNLENGLSHKVCRTRLERFGRNELFLPEPRTVGSFARRILRDPSLLVLLIVSVIALCFAHFAVALTVLFVTAVSCAVSIVAYVKTGRIKERMSSYSAPRVRLLRNGSVLLCDASAVVPGDVLLLDVGDVVPCDARLVASTSNFCVLTYRIDAEGKGTYAMTPKNAAELYEENEIVPELKRVNMVYAGAVVHQGRARAVVTETGENTFIGFEYGPHALAAQVGDPSYLSLLRKYMSRYSLWMCVMILPLTVAGIFVGRGSLSILDALFLTVALVASSLSEQVLSMGRIVCASSVIRASIGGKEKNTAVIKNYRAIDAISRVDELFVLGRTAISDGRLHPYAVYTSDSLFLGPKMQNEAVRSLYEMVYYYEKCASDPSHRAAFGDRTVWQSSVWELCGQLGFDRESADIRIAALRPLEFSAAWVEVTLRGDMETGDRRFRVHCCSEPEPLFRCNARRTVKGTAPLDTAQCKQLADIFSQLKNQGTEVCAYIREEGGLTVFEGIVSFREAFAPDLAETLAELEQKHVRVSLFMPEEGKYHLNYLIASGWIDSGKDAVSASRLQAAGKTLADVFDKRRVFFGFSDDQIAEQISRSRAEGKVTASLGLRHGDSPLLTPADVCFSCEPRPYDVDADEHGHEHARARVLSVEECDQSVRRRADVLIRRADPEGGGLAGIRTAIDTARAIHFRMMLALQYLLVAQLLRITTVVLPLLFGHAMISPALLLISGVWVDLAYILICAFHHCSPDVLREPPDGLRFFKAPLRTRPDWVCATVVCGIFTALTAWVLSGTRTAVSGAGLELYVFLSLLFSQTCLVLCLLRATGNASRHWRAHASLLLVFAVLIVLLCPILLIPPVASWFGAGGASVLVFGLAVLSPLYLIGCYFLSMTYRPRLTRIFRVYARSVQRRGVKKRKDRAYTDDENRGGQE